MTYQTPSPHPVKGWATIALPPDMLDEEVTDLVLFRLSLLLNRATGGAADMTFSARTALSCRRAGPRGWIWHLPRIVIDLYCNRFRGEVDHCDTALANHRRRGQ